MPTTYPAKQGEWSTGPETKDQDLLSQIQARFKYMTDAWKAIRDEAELDQRALSTTGPWTDEDLNARKEKGRPAIHLDQLSQHVHELVNEVRSNPIAIKVDPAGEGSDEQTAELRSKRIRAIEYESNAVNAYQTAFEHAASMGFGAFGITIEYKAWDSTERRIKVRRFSNPYSVIWDPDCLEQDCSDMRDCFVLTRMLREDFEREYPEAQISSMGEDHHKVAAEWFADDSVQVAEYWYRETKKRRLFVLDMPDGRRQKLFADEIEGFKVVDGYLIFRDSSAARIVHDRKTEQPFIRMCITNGVEILDRTEWPGKYIPIIPVLGREVYYRVGNQVKRMLESYIRKARAGQMLFDYYASNEAETISMAPKMPWIGYKGQFVEEYWDTINQEPRAYAEVEPKVQGVPETLPLPQRNAYEPPIQALEIGKESTRRAIQAAIGSYGFTRLDDTNVKSGVALERLKAQNNLGSYHLIDNYKIAIKLAGRIINDLLDDVETEPMTVSLRGMDDTQETVNINQAGPDGKKLAYRLTDDGQHEVTLSSGPSYQSQREKAAEFNKNLLQALPNLPLQPPQAAKILALAVQLEQLGPLGDKMVEIIDPEQSKQQIPPQVMQAIQQAQRQMQALNAYAKEMEQKVVELQDKIDSKEAENANRLEIARMQEETKRLLKLAELQSREGIVELQERVKAIQAQQEMALAERREDAAERQGETEAQQRQQEIEQAGNTAS